MAITLTGTIIGRNHRPPGDNPHGVMNNGQPWPIDQVATLEDVKLTLGLGTNVQPRELDIRLPSLPTQSFQIGAQITVTIAEVVTEPMVIPATKVTKP